MKLEAEAAARRYARALLDVAAKDADPGRLRDELSAAARVLRDHPDLRSALTHPALGAERRSRLARASFAGCGGELLQRLVGLLAERGRFALLPAIEAAYAAAWNHRRGVVSAEAVTAVELAPAQLEALREAIRGKTGREVELAARVDESLLGGVVLHLAGRVYDGSVRAHLRGLRERLSGAGAAAGKE